MKVPNMYKSSDRYNAGTDVIYDDDSKLQYAPFIYAGITAKDNGDDDGGDEEGEDTMVINYDGTKLDKSFKEITDALSAGKFVYIFYTEAVESNVDYYLYYFSSAEKSGDYVVDFKNLNNTTLTLSFSSETEDGVLNVLT